MSLGRRSAAKRSRSDVVVVTGRFRCSSNTQSISQSICQSVSLSVKGPSTRTAENAEKHAELWRLYRATQAKRTRGRTDAADGITSTPQSSKHRRNFRWGYEGYSYSSPNFQSGVPYSPLLSATKVAICSHSVIAKFHYTGPTAPDQTKSADFVGDPGLRPGSREKVRAGRLGSGRVRVVEFSLYATARRPAFMAAYVSDSADLITPPVWVD